MLPLGTVLTTVAPGQWMVSRTPDAKAAVIAAFPDTTKPNDVWAQLEGWSTVLHSFNLPGLVVPVPLRLPDAVPRLAYDLIPWRVGADGLSAVPTSTQVIAVLRVLAETLDALHARNVAHGALGLASLWWQSAERVVLPDVGLAHVLDGLVSIPTIAAAYHAPEIWRGGSPTPASDQYALAIVAFELFTGKQRAPVADVEGIVAFEPLVVDAHHEIFRDEARGMHDVFQRALAAAPTSRFASCVAFVEALEGHVPTLESLRTFHQPLQRFRQRMTWRGAGFTAAALAAITTAVVISRKPTAPASLAESVTARIPSMANVETILPGQSASQSSPGGGFGSRQRAGATLEGERVSGTGPERLNLDPDPSSIRTAGSTEAPSTGTARDQQGTISRVPARTVSTASGAKSEQSGATTARSTPATTSDAVLSDSGVTAGGVGNAVSGAVSNVVRAVTGAPAPITGERAAASAELSRSGTIKLDVPNGSRVYLDGVLLAGTPRNITTSPGPHDLDVVLPGSTVPQRRRVTVVSADTTSVRMRAR